MSKLTKILTLTLTLLIATVANATLIAYEPFDYAPTNGLNGLDGGTGWDSMNWYGAVDGSQAIVSPGKTYSNGDTLYTIGNMGVTMIDVNWKRASRDFSTSLNSAEGTTNWFSFLASVETDATYMDNGQYLIGFQSETDVNNIRFMCRGDVENGEWFLNKPGSPNYVSGHTFISNETIFVVIQKANGATEDTWTAWVNPPVNQAPVYSNSFGGNYPHSVVKGVHFWKGGANHFASKIDEYRIGESWDDVNTDEPIMVHTPVNDTPTNYQNDVSLTTTLEASSFDSDDGADTHSASLFHVESIDGIIVLNTNVGGVTSFNIPSGLLEENTRYFWTVSYKGSHSTKWSSASDLTYFDTTYTVEPLQFAYEGVTYDETTNGIASYNKGEGWRDGWNALQGYNFWISQQDVVAPGLSYRLLEVTNNTFIARNQIGIYGILPGQTTTNGSSSAVRKLKRDGFASLLNQNNHFGGPNITTWISGIIEAPVDAVVASNKYSLELRNSTGNTITYIGKSSGKETWGIEWKDSDEDVVPGEPTFLVAKIVYTTTNSTISLWVNPTLGEQPTTNTVADTLLLDDSDYYYDSVAMFVQRSEGCLLPEVKFDELRVGIDWLQVMPGAKSVIPDIPSNIAPANATADVSLDTALNLEGSAFSSESGDSILKSEFHIESLGGVVYVVTGTTETATLSAGTLQEDCLYTLKIRYFSSLSGLPSGYSDGTTFSTVWSTKDTPIAYDGADYTVGDNVDDLNGGYGWATAWNVKDYSNTNLPMNVEVVTPGMSFDSLPVNGNAFYVNESALITNRSYISAGRELKTGDGVYHLMADDDKFGKPGSTNWLSFLAEIGEDCTNQTFGVGIGNGWPTLRVDGYYLPETDLVTWKLGGMAGAAATTDSVKTNETAFLVARFISGSETETNGTGYLWVNPVLGESPPAIEDAVSSKTNIAYLAFNDLYALGDLYNSLISVVTNIPEPAVTNITTVYEAPAKVEYDEIRFGETWMGVTGVPEPGLVFLALGMILAVLGLRK